MKIGIIGLRGAGKTTAFSALTGLTPAPAAGGKLSVQLGHTPVPDSRVDWLTDLVRPKKTTYAGIDFVDIAGMAAEPGQGLEPEVLTHLRAADALVQVVQAFENLASPFRSGPPDPAGDLAELTGELLLTDLLVVEKRMERLVREQQTGTVEFAALEHCKAALEAEQALRTLALSPEEAKAVASFQFLTRKPMLVLVNVSELEAAAPVPAGVAEQLGDTGAEALTLAAAAEAEIAQLEPEEQAAFLADLGVNESARARFIRAAYALLDLITFLTVGEKDVRAWPIPKGTTAVDAAGTIHSDLARGFIRGEVVAFSDFQQAKSMAGAKQAGTFRLEGKTYVVQDGDILHVRFNV